jgi:molybdate transport system substrate-binding protein
MRLFISSILIALILCGAAFVCGCIASDENDAQNTTSTPAAGNDPILVYCGAGMRVPMEEIGKAFEEKTGIPVIYNFAGSGHLLAQMELTKKGDVYLPGATMDFEEAKAKGFVAEEAKLAYHVPVIVTPKGNPSGIESLEDLTKTGTRLVLGDPEAMPLGKLGEQIFTKAGIKDEVNKNVIGRRTTANELVTDILLGQADASIIWEELYDPEKMEIIHIPNEMNVIKVVPVGTLTFSKQPETAKMFIEFVKSDDGGKTIFAKHGFIIYPNDKYEI